MGGNSAAAVAADWSGYQSGTLTYFRAWDEDADPAALLEPSEQFSTPWGEPDHGRCDKCGGAGRTRWRCRSCLSFEAEPSCEACGGRVTFVEECPACEGSGEITRTRRDGVSVFGTEAGLYLYLAERGADLDGKVVIELDGQLSGDLDLDADAGALLIRPTAVVGARPLRPDLLERARARVAELLI